MLSEKLFEMAQKIEELEYKLESFDDLKRANTELIGENDYLRYLLRELGVEDVHGDFSLSSLSVADVMALEKAIQTAMV